MPARPDQVIGGFDSTFYLLAYPDVAAAGVDPLVHFNSVGWKEGRMPNGLFDTTYYLATYPDIAAANINPFQHYLAVGWKEGRDPSPFFDTSAYLAANPDVAAAGVNPLAHFLGGGVFEGRTISGSPSPTNGSDFLIGTAGSETINAGDGNDIIYALKGNDSVDGGTGKDTARFSGKFADYTITFAGDQVLVSGPEGSDSFTNIERFAFSDVTFDRSVPGTNPLIDEFYYYSLNKDVWLAGVDAAAHFAANGWKEGRDPNPFFDISYYLEHNPDVAAAGVNPLQHYLTFGFKEGRDPSAEFDTSAYLEHNPDVAAAGINPLLHYLAFGKAEGRSPEGTTQTSVTSLEDTDHVFVAGDFDFGGLGSIQSVEIDVTGLAHGTLLLNGTPLTGAGNTVLMTDITAGHLVFHPATDGAGNGYASFHYVGSDGATSSTPGVMTVNLTPVNDAPAGTSTTVTALEDTGYAFTVANFGLTDPHDSPANGLLGVKISTLPGSGTLTNNGSAVTAGQSVSAADIAAGHLVFTPASNTNGAGNASFTFQVQDNGGTDNGGVDTDATPNTMTIDVTAVNDAPAGANNTITMNEDGTYTFAAADFGFTDPSDSGQSLASVTITTIPSSGLLKNNGVTVTAGQSISLSDITSNHLTFAPAANANGASYTSFTFQVRDDGGTANGGVDIDQSPNTMTISVTAVNDAPAGTDKAVTVLEDGVYTFGASDFGFSDPIDGTHTLSGVKITTLPSNGTLKLNGSNVTAGDTIAAANIGQLTFEPAADANGDNYTAFTFQVIDNGGTANGGVDTDQSANTITVNVTPVNDAPAGANATLTINEDTPHSFVQGDFGFTDSDGNSFAAVKITAMALNGGTLTLVTDADPVPVTLNQVIAVADIPGLVFTPAPDANGLANASISFQVEDNGGTTNGGIDLDPTANTITFDVTAVNDAPRNIAFAQPNPVPEGTVATDGFGVVGTVSATDIEGDTPLTYALINEDGSPYSGPFAINATTGEITIVTTDPLALDYEADESHTVELIVQVTDATIPTGASARHTIAITLADVEPETTGSLIDGYIAGATIFVDENGNKTYDVGEYTTTTDAVGSFKIVGTHNGTLYLTGGTDTSTNLPFTGVMRAPSGSTVVTPITTLVVALIEAAAAEIPPRTLTVSEATQKVAAALGLNAAIDYNNYDPVIAAINGATSQDKANGEAAFAAGVQVYNTIVQASSLLTGAGATDAATAVATTVATQLETAANSSTTISLSNQTVLQDVISGASTIAPPATAISSQTITDAAQVMSENNGVISDAVANPGVTGTSLLVAVVGAATVAQGGAATALATAGQNDDASGAVSGYTGGSLSTEVGTATTTASARVDQILGPNGDNDLVGTDGADILDGQGGNDNLFGGGGKDILIGGTGNDVLYGDTLVVSQASRAMGFDRADYSAATEGVNVNLGAGTVVGGASVGNDTLVSIEGIIGTNFVDTFNASTYSTTSANNGGIGYTFTTGIGAVGLTNHFEGRGGNDTITGNGATRVSYQSASAKVLVDLQAGTAYGYNGTAPGSMTLDGGDAAGVGVDNITGGVNAVRGSNFDDYIKGRNDNGNAAETFEGLRGDDFIDGNGGFDRVRYDFESTGELGIIVNLGAGTVTGRDAASIAVVGHDTLRSIEGVRGSNSADIFDASTFTATSTNGGGSGAGPVNQGNFNEFEGLGGNDTITGNGNTRVGYYNATAGVTIVFTGAGVGTATGDASVGTDTFLGGVTWVRGSNFNDTIIGYNNGSTNFETFDGWAGNDFIDGGLGLDRVRYDGNNGDASGRSMGTNGLTFNMAAGTATAIDGIGSDADFNYGTDTLRGIEAIRGTNSNDIYTAVGFGAGSTNAGSQGDFNEFEGGLGNDDITGNGSTRVSYQNASNSVNVNLATGATGSAGTDTFHGGINAVRGSNSNDILTGTNNPNNTAEYFEGMGGNDQIDGLGGYDVARYDNHSTNSFGINVSGNASTKTVTRLSPGANDGVGTDTLTNIEGVRGTNFADTYNAANFGAGNFNEFEGMGGNDSITGNGATRISYLNSSSSVNVDLAANIASGAASGTDTLFGGINAVRGSQYADTIRGSNFNDFLEGRGGNDTFRFIDTAFGHDTILDFQAGAGTDDVIQFDHTVFANFDAVMAAATTSGADVLITLDASNSIRLSNVSIGSLHSTDFLFI